MVRQSVSGSSQVWRNPKRFRHLSPHAPFEIGSINVPHRFTANETWRELSHGQKRGRLSAKFVNRGASLSARSTFVRSTGRVISNRPFIFDPITFPWTCSARGHFPENPGNFHLVLQPVVPFRTEFAREYSLACLF